MTRVPFSVRPGAEASVLVEVRQLERYPVDLYYLVDVSASMQENLDQVGGAVTCYLQPFCSLASLVNGLVSVAAAEDGGRGPVPADAGALLGPVAGLRLLRGQARLALHRRASVQDQQPLQVGEETTGRRLTSCHPFIVFRVLCCLKVLKL